MRAQCIYSEASFTSLIIKTKLIDLYFWCSKSFSQPEPGPCAKKEIIASQLQTARADASPSYAGNKTTANMNLRHPSPLQGAHQTHFPLCSSGILSTLSLLIRSSTALSQHKIFFHPFIPSWYHDPEHPRVLGLQNPLSIESVVQKALQLSQGITEDIDMQSHHYELVFGGKERY